MSTLKQIRIGSRASPLAMIQAKMVRSALISAHGLTANDVAIIPVTASGDKVLDRPLADIGGKALWTKELDQWLMAGEIDCAVHSMKDVETIRPTEIAIAAMLPRADVRDCLIGAEKIGVLPNGARVGTSSPRRAAQVLNQRPDVSITLFRGNVATRLSKLEAGEADATLLAKAGLDRLGQGDLGHPIPLNVMLSAPAQGAIGIECRADDGAMRDALTAISDVPTLQAVMLERGLLARLGADCHSPVAALAVPDGSRFRFRAQLLSEDGAENCTHETMIAPGDGAALDDFAHALLSAASPNIRAMFGK